MGANKGQSVKFFKSIYPFSTIYAFEPSRKIFNKLKSIVENYGSTEVLVFQIGLGEMSGVVDFHESILSETSSFVLPNENSKYLKSKNRILLQKSQNSFKSIPTQVTTIDDFVKENKIIDIDILKIDVEGFEFEVMLGAKKVLGDGKVKIVQFERHTNDMRADQFHEIDRFLKSLNYFKVKELKHPFGDFYELIYQKQ